MRSIFCFLLLLTLALPAKAQIAGWSGAAGTDRFTASNWTLGVPVGGNVVFSATPTNTTLDLGGGTSAALANVIFQFSNVPAYTIQNGTLLMANGGDIRINDGAAAVTQTITANIVYQGGGSLTNNETAATLTVGNVFSNLLGTHTLTVNAIGTVNINGMISNGTGGAVLGLTKTGSGWLNLAGNNNYTGTTTINAGTLNIQTVANNGTNSSLGGGSSLVFNGGTLRYANTATDGSTNRAVTLNAGGGTLDVADAARTLRLTGTFAGSGGLTKTGPGTLTLAGSNTYTGTTTITAGVIDAPSITNAGDNGSLGSGSSIVFNGGTLKYYGATSFVSTDRTVTVNAGGGTIDVLTNSHEVGLFGPISGSGTLTKIGLGRLYPRGNNAAFTGGVTVNSGFLFLSNDAPTWTNSAFTVNDGEIHLFPGGPATFTLGSLAGGGRVSGFFTGAAVNLVIGTDNTSTTFAGTITTSFGGDVLSLTKTGTGTLSLTFGISNYTGATTINAGTLSIRTVAQNGVNSSLGQGSSLVFNGGTLRYDNSSEGGSTNRTVTLNAGGGTIDLPNSALDLSGVMSGSGGLTKTGPGTLTLTGTSSYSGTTSVAGGTLSVQTVADGGVNSSIGAGSNITISNNATLRYANTTTDGSTDRAVTLYAGGGTFDVVGSPRVLTLSGVVSGSGGLTKTGPGTLTLPTSNSYTGPTIITGGTLIIAGVSLTSGLNSPIGASSSAAANLVLDGGTLRPINNLFFNDRLFTLGPAGGTFDFGNRALYINGEGLVAFSSPGTDRTLTLAGEAVGINPRGQILASIGDAGAGKVGITKIGAGAWVLAGTNTYSGPTIIQAGILRLLDGADSGNSDYTVASGAVLETNTNIVNGNFNIGSLAGAGTVRSNIGGHHPNIRVGATGLSTTFSGAILNSTDVQVVSLTKVGTGTLTLTGTGNAYTGSTTINAGTLCVNGSLGNTAVTINSGATLSGTGTVNGSVTVNSNGTVAPGASIGTLTVGSTAFTPGGRLAIEYNPAALTPLAGTDNDLLLGRPGRTLDLATLNPTDKFIIHVTSVGGTAAGGPVSYTVAQFDVITGATPGNLADKFSVSGSFAGTPTVMFADGPIHDSLIVTFNPVPEPASLIVLAAGLLAVAKRRRRN